MKTKEQLLADYRAAQKAFSEKASAETYAAYIAARDAMVDANYSARTRRRLAQGKRI